MKRKNSVKNYAQVGKEVLLRSKDMMRNHLKLSNKTVMAHKNGKLINCNV